MKNKILKLFRSILKILLPFLFKILIYLKLNRRTINYLSDRGYNSNTKYNFNELIKNLLQSKKIIALDVGAQGGFNSDDFFPSKYNHFFENILVEPIKAEADKLNDKKHLINKGLWSKRKNYIF